MEADAAIVARNIQVGGGRDIGADGALEVGEHRRRRAIGAGTDVTNGVGAAAASVSHGAAGMTPFRAALTKQRSGLPVHPSPGTQEGVRRLGQRVELAALHRPVGGRQVAAVE